MSGATSDDDPLMYDWFNSNLIVDGKEVAV